MSSIILVKLKLMCNITTVGLTGLSYKFSKSKLYGPVC